jgi:hypothetical protein
MAGVKRPQTQYRLKFADGDLAGLEVTARAPSLDELVKAAPLAEVIDAANPDMAKVAELLEMFGRLLVSWNFEEEDGTPVPATPAGLVSLEFAVTMEILTAWAEHVVRVAPPLPNGSGPGQTPRVPEGSIPMETPSSSRSSSRKRS